MGDGHPRTRSLADEHEPACPQEDKDGEAARTKGLGSEARRGALRRSQAVESSQCVVPGNPGGRLSFKQKHWPWMSTVWQGRERIGGPARALCSLNTSSFQKRCFDETGRNKLCGWGCCRQREGQEGSLGGGARRHPGGAQPRLEGRGRVRGAEPHCTWHQEIRCALTVGVDGQRRRGTGGRLERAAGDFGQRWPRGPRRRLG